MSAVHFKFKAALEFSAVTFDGTAISVGELKKEILEQKGFGKNNNADFDLQIQNAQTKEVYQNEFDMIPKNTSVTVARVPIVENKNKKKFANGGGGEAGGGRYESRFKEMQRNHLASLPPADLARGVDLASLDMDEEEKIKAMMCQSTAEYDPSRYMKIRGSTQHGKVPSHYRCHRCNNTGHWIKDCPMNSHDSSSDVKKSTGIPRSFMVMVDGPEVRGALITPEGRYIVPAVDNEAYSSISKPKAAPPEPPPPKPKIPEELICPLCHDLLTDALLVPCCANSYCDECIRNALTESDDLVCPGCNEKETPPNALIPNRFLRSAVSAFKNDTGYSKPSKIPEKKEQESRKQALLDSIESRKITVDKLPEDLFPHSPRKIESVLESSDQVDSVKAGECTGTNSSDLYNYNEESIPSPFAIQQHVCALISSVVDTTKDSAAIKVIETVQNQSETLNHHRPPLLPSNQENSDNFGKAPLNYSKNSPRMNWELSSPDFWDEDVAPPGEERILRSPRNRQAHLTTSRNDRQGPFDSSFCAPPPPLIPGLPPLTQPPPGYGPPPPTPVSMYRPPPIGPGPLTHDQYPPNFTRMPPPPIFPIYAMGPYPHMDVRHRVERDRYRDQDDYDRERRSSRRSYYYREGTSSSSSYGRSGSRRSYDENRQGKLIEDPLREFEKLMREKDRRKKHMSGHLIKRSPTPPVSSKHHQNHSPSLPKRSRSRSQEMSLHRSLSPQPAVITHDPCNCSRSRSRISSPHNRSSKSRRSPTPHQSSHNARSPKLPAQSSHKARSPKLPTQSSHKARSPKLPAQSSHKARSPKLPTQSSHKARSPKPAQSSHKARSPKLPTQSSHKARSPKPAQSSYKARSPKLPALNSRSPARLPRRSRSPHIPGRRSQSPPQPTLKVSSPPKSVPKSRSPAQRLRKSLSPLKSTGKSLSPPQPVETSLSPPELEQKSENKSESKKKTKSRHHRHHRHRHHHRKKSSGEKKAKKKKHKKPKKKDKETKKKDKEEKKDKAEKKIKKRKKSKAA